MAGRSRAAFDQDMRRPKRSASRIATRCTRQEATEIAGGPEVKKVFEELKALKQFTDDGYANRNWNDTTNLVITDKAALQIMGDWARGEFAAAGMIGVKDFGCMIGLNEDKPIVSTDGDMIVFSEAGRSGQVEAAQKRLAALLISPEVQVAFNNAKGSMPVRADVDMATADPCMQKALKAVDDPKQDRHRGPTASSPKTPTNEINELITQYCVGRLHDGRRRRRPSSWRSSRIPTSRQRSEAPPHGRRLVPVSGRGTRSAPSGDRPVCVSRLGCAWALRRERQPPATRRKVLTRRLRCRTG